MRILGYAFESYRPILKDLIQALVIQIMSSTKGFNTRAVHSGELQIPEFGNVITPVFQSATFHNPNRSEHPYNDNTRDSPYLYTRLGNPTIQAMEEKYASLENARYALGFSSGMAAISSSVFSLNRSGTSFLSIEELYGETYGLFSSGLRKYGINVEFNSVDILNKLEFDPSGKSMVYLESIINPTMKVADVSGIAKICSEYGVPLLVDATFSSPYNQKPLDQGASVAIHSGTKYISGHSDITLGLVGTSDASLYSGISDIRKNFGPSMDPLQSYLAMRGMKTLGLRVEKQNQGAIEIAKYLQQHRKVENTSYPGLENSPYRKIAEKNLRGFGGMLSFELKSGLDGARRLLEHLQVPRAAASLGGVESLVSLPLDTSHVNVPPEKRREMGIPDGLIRFSCGIEDPEDLIADLENALKAV